MFHQTELMLFGVLVDRVKGMHSEYLIKHFPIQNFSCAKTEERDFYGKTKKKKEKIMCNKREEKSSFLQQKVKRNHDVRENPLMRLFRLKCLSGSAFSWMFALDKFQIYFQTANEL